MIFRLFSVDLDFSHFSVLDGFCKSLIGKCQKDVCKDMAIQLNL